MYVTLLAIVTGNVLFTAMMIGRPHLADAVDYKVSCMNVLYIFFCIKVETHNN